ncbi:dentin sialophosphoprotein-like isoform X1 [Ixodes scapularis]|uniref:dentin sialophosphoprotein-like isoform X1 n=1 Tax=Ixodes scapularis TaxID=6945 RepID=UPI001C3883F5|nr:dentin sialophosphoprotein-like isoform X1 [Ixodes scapularis]
MPGKRQYGKYLWNTNCKIPSRSKCRLKNRRTVERPTVESDDSENHAEDNDTPGQSQDTGATRAARAATPQSQSCDNTDGDNADAGHRACVDTAAAMDSAAESEDETGNKLSSSEDSPDPSSSEDSSDPSSSDSEDESDAPTSPKPGSRSELDELLYPAAKLSMAESLLMVMGHSLRHCSSKEATESVLKLIDSHLPKDTKFVFSIN